MYKKRFAKWGFHKNARRSAATTKNECTRLVRRKSPGSLNSPRGLGSVPAYLELSYDDRLMFMFLTNVRMSSMAFFETVHAPNGLLASRKDAPWLFKPWPDNTKEITFAFKLVMNLLDRGHGGLAGRAARKAFLLVEDMLTIEGPALVWDLLEMMHHMVTEHHVQLFQMLLAHLVALVDGRIPKTHPVAALLRCLRGLVVTLTRARSTPRSSSATTSDSPPSSTSPSSSSDEALTATNPSLLSGALLSLLEQGWVLNAQILFDNFDSRLFNLYCRVHWETCSITPPAAIFGTMQRWYSAAVGIEPANARMHIPPIEYGRMLQILPDPRLDASPPGEFEELRASSFAALRQYGNLILRQEAGFLDSTTTMLRVLAGLVTVNTFEEWHGVAESPVTSAEGNQVSLAHAEIVACVIRTLIALDPKYGGNGLASHMDAIEGMRFIIAIREYARGETDPQLLQEMFLLKDALTAAGRYSEAEEVGQSALRRVEKYIQDIPVASA